MSVFSHRQSRIELFPLAVDSSNHPRNIYLKPAMDQKAAREHLSPLSCSRVRMAHTGAVVGGCKSEGHLGMAPTERHTAFLCALAHVYPLPQNTLPAGDFGKLFLEFREDGSMNLLPSLNLRLFLRQVSCYSATAFPWLCFLTCYISPSGYLG